MTFWTISFLITRFILVIEHSVRQYRKTCRQAFQGNDEAVREACEYLVHTDQIRSLLIS